MKAARRILRLKAVLQPVPAVTMQAANVQITEKTETTGATTYDVKLADNLTLGSEATVQLAQKGQTAPLP